MDYKIEMMRHAGRPRRPHILQVIRKDLGLPDHELAELYGVEQHDLTRLERGLREEIPESVLSYLESVGYSREQIIEDNENYIRERKERIREARAEIARFELLGFDEDELWERLTEEHRKEFLKDFVERWADKSGLSVRLEFLVSDLKREPPWASFGWIVYMLESLDDHSEDFDKNLRDLKEGLEERLRLGHWKGDHTPEGRSSS